MSQNVLGSFRREEQEGLMVRKGARPPGERERGRESRQVPVQGIRDCLERKRAPRCPTNNSPKGSRTGVCKAEGNQERGAKWEASR